MNKEQLLAVGLTDEQTEKILALHTEDLKGYIPRSRFNEVNNEKNNLAEQLKTVNEALDTLKENNKDNVALQNTINEKEQALNDLKENHALEIQKLKLNNAVESSLLKAKTRNIKAVKALLDESKIELSEEGVVKGLDEQIKALAESDPYLFGDKKPIGNKPLNGMQRGDEGEPATIGERIAKMQNKQLEENSKNNPWA